MTNTRAVYREVVRTADGLAEFIERDVQAVDSRRVAFDCAQAVTDCPAVSIVVVANSHSPSRLARCLRAISSTAEWADEVIVVDNGTDKFTHDMLAEELVDCYTSLLTVSDYIGWLPAVDMAFKQVLGKIVVLVDPNVEVFPGWLERITTVARASKVAMVTVWSTQQVLPLPGENVRDTAAIVAAVGGGRSTDNRAPASGVLAINRDAFEQAGGWQVERFGPGYGAVMDLHLRFETIGLRTVVADGVLVDDTKPRAVNIGKHGSQVLQRRWGAHHIEASIGNGPPSPADVVARAAGYKRRTKGPAVVWLFRECVVCGASLLAVHVSNELIDRGWQSYITSINFKPGQQARMPMRFTPLVFTGRREQVEHLVAHLPKNSVVIAPLFVAVEDAIEIGDRRPDVRVVYYVQDDEAQFRTPVGELVHPNPDAVADSYKLIKNVVANSLWVGKLVERTIGRDVPVITPGVDPLMFYPRQSPGARPRVMAHCRPSTPRRGWAFIAAVMRSVAMHRHVEFFTYDEDPEGPKIPGHHHLGQLSPEQLAREMAIADVFIEGSDVQGFGMQALESMACGCALVCTPNDGINTFGTPGDDCVIVPHDDVRRAAGVVCRLVEHVDERQVLGASARETACAFDWAAVGDAWHCYLEGLTDA